MFFSSSHDEGSAPAPVLFDQVLPDALRRARHAALLPLAHTLRARGWTEPKLLVLRALTQAGEPLSQTEAAARAGLSIGAVRPHVSRLVADGYVAWTGATRTFGYAKIAARDIGRRQINHIAREAAKHGAKDWAALAAQPAEARVSERARRRLGTLMTKLQRACTREAVLEHANAPTDDDDLVFGLPVMLRRTRAALMRRVSPVLRHYDVTEAPWRVLRMLADQPGIGLSVTALGRRGCFHFGDPAVRRALISLNDRGLVRRSGLGERPMAWRQAWHGPRKQFRAEISRAGLDMVKRIEAREASVCADLFQRLSGAEMGELDRLLHRVTLALLWRDGVAPEDQEVHPLGAHYAHYDSHVRVAARALEKHNRLLKENSLPERHRAVTHWWE